jgi:hypothetical protein
MLQRNCVKLCDWKTLKAEHLQQPANDFFFFAERVKILDFASITI